MTAKKLILTALLLIALNLSFEPGHYTFSQKERHSIVHVIDISDDPYTSDFISANKKAIQAVSVSLTALILAADLYYNNYDTS